MLERVGCIRKGTRPTWGWAHRSPAQNQAKEIPEIEPPLQFGRFGIIRRIRGTAQSGLIGAEAMRPRRGEDAAFDRSVAG